MNTPEWIGLIVTVIGLAIGYGVLKGTVSALRERDVEQGEQIAALREELRRETADLRSSNERQGTRIGALETKAALAERELSRPYLGSKGAKE